MRLQIHHVTSYNYPKSVANSINEVWLRPLTDRRQTCLSFALTTTPASTPRPYTDYFGNTVYHFDVFAPHERLEIVADAEVETLDGDGSAALAADPSPYGALDGAAQDRWLDYLAETSLTTIGPATRALADELSAARLSVAALLQTLAERVHAALRYQAGVTGVDTTAEQALATAAGVCQDYTHAFLAVCHALAIPARYISGYLCTGVGENQAQASHAWPEALLPLGGWVGFDPTNGRLVDGRYVRVAVGRDYSDVPPVRGAYSGPPSRDGMDVSVYVLNEQQQQQQ